MISSTRDNCVGESIGSLIVCRRLAALFYPRLPLSTRRSTWLYGQMSKWDKWETGIELYNIVHLILELDHWGRRNTVMHRNRGRHFVFLREVEPSIYL